MTAPLGVGEVRAFWLLAAEAPPEAHADALAWMSSEERRRHDRFAFEHSRAEHRLTRWLVRATLSRFAPVEPGAWRFVPNAHGRPEIAGPETRFGLRFNASNTRGLVAVAVARDHDVGVDVEETSRPPALEMAPRYFAPREVAALDALPASERAERFWAHWTLKEAYIKARGMGLALPLDAFAFDVDTDPVRVAFDPRVADDPARWAFSRHAPTPRHRLALAVPAGARVTLERV